MRWELELELGFVVLRNGFINFSSELVNFTGCSSFVEKYCIRNPLLIACFLWAGVKFLIFFSCHDYAAVGIRPFISMLHDYTYMYWKYDRLDSVNPSNMGILRIHELYGLFLGWAFTWKIVVLAPNSLSQATRRKLGKPKRTQDFSLFIVYPAKRLYNALERKRQTLDLISTTKTSTT